MSIDQQLQTTEELQELFDRRTRILQDLKIVDETISAKLGELLGEAVALPSMAARGSGTQRRGRVTQKNPPARRSIRHRPPKALPAAAKAPKYERPASRKKRAAPPKGGTTAKVLEVLKGSPRRDFPAHEVASLTQCSVATVRATLVRLVNQKRLQRTKPGVYRWAAPKS